MWLCRLRGSKRKREEGDIMLRALAALLILVWAPVSAFAEPPAAPDPYMVGPQDAPGPGSLAGTRWQVTLTWDDGGENEWAWAQFDPDGQLTYGYTDGRVFTNGRWRQRGAVVVWDTNSMFNTGLGYVAQGRMSGAMTNVRGQNGRWTFVLASPDGK
jgi:hypothetical protein